MAKVMQKVKNVNKYCSIILLIVSVLSAYSQKKLEGRFHNNSDFYKFYPDNTFEFRQVGELGAGGYGKGSYTLTTKKLILNFNLTDIKVQGYHILKPYINFKDTVSIGLKFFDFDKNSLQGVQVLFFGQDNFLVQGVPNENGNVHLYTQRKQGQNTIQIVYEDCTYMFDLQFDFCYEIEVYLSKKPDYLVGTAIKNFIQEYKITKIKDDYFEVETLNGILLKFERTKEDFYYNDPFK